MWGSCPRMAPWCPVGRITAVTRELQVFLPEDCSHCTHGTGPVLPEGLWPCHVFWCVRIQQELWLGCGWRMAGSCNVAEAPSTGGAHPLLSGTGAGFLNFRALVYGVNRSMRSSLSSLFPGISNI